VRRNLFPVLAVVLLPLPAWGQAVPSREPTSTHIFPAGGKRGTFVLSHVGAFVDGAASGTWTVVQGSGTDDLEGLTGSSAFSIPKGEERFPFALDYEIRQPAGVS